MLAGKEQEKNVNVMMMLIKKKKGGGREEGEEGKGGGGGGGNSYQAAISRALPSMRQGSTVFPALTFLMLRTAL